MELRGFGRSALILGRSAAAGALSLRMRACRIVQLHFGQFMPGKVALAAGADIDARRYQR
ncbi:MAG: hypothetical protein ABSG67_16730 [Thermoguttaceae bacterium]|jgi:hypothetical protein